MLNEVRFRWLLFLYWTSCINGALSQRFCKSANGSFSFENTPVYPVQYGDCSFATSLCNYTQYCTDPDAENWRQNEGYAECPGKNGLLDAFSVLTSPLLDVKHLTCLKFEYTQNPPGKLSVYLVTSTSSITLMSENDSPINPFLEHMANIENTTGRVLFRARSPNTDQTVQIRNVQLVTGSCTVPDCSFGDDMTDCSSATCGWSIDGWNITKSLPASADTIKSLHSCFAYVTQTMTEAKLTTALVRATGSETACLEFSYILCGLKARLLVSVQPLERASIPQWSLSSDDEINCRKSWRQAQVTVSSSSAFKVIFENQPASEDGGIIAIDSVRFSHKPACPITPGCAQPLQTVISSQTPPGAATAVLLSTSQYPDLTRTPEPTTSQYPDLTRTPEPTTSQYPDLTRTPEPTTSQNPLNEKRTNDSTTAVTAGVVAGVMIVIVCIVAVAVVLWKGRQKPPTQKEILGDSEIHNRQNYVVPLNRCKLALGETSTTLADARKLTIENKMDQYEDAEDGIPGKTRFTTNDKHDSPRTQSIVDNETSESTDQELQDSKSHLTTDSPDSECQGSNLNGVYSQVRKINTLLTRTKMLRQNSFEKNSNKKYGEKNEKDFIPGEEVGIYSFAEGSTPPEVSVKPETYAFVQKGKKKTPELYTQVQKPEKEMVPKNQEASGHGPKTLSSPQAYEYSEFSGVGAMVGASQEDDDEYNTLNFELDAQGRSGISQREATGRTYDHIQRDDLYARIQQGRREANTVADAECDHLRN